MKNGSMADKLKMQEKEISFASEKKKEKEDLQEGRYADKQEELTEGKSANKQENNLANNAENKHDSNSTDLGLSSVFSILPSSANISPSDEPQLKPVKKKKKKPKQRLS